MTSLSALSRVKVTVTGARGPVGLKLKSTPTPGQFVVFTADREVQGSAGTGADSGLRTDLAAATGANLVGFKRDGGVSRSAGGKLAEQPITPDDFAGTDTQKVQAALDARGSILLTRAYSITAALTMRGDTQLRGKPGAKLVWSGSATGNILQDSSIVASSDVNVNILLENFEIDGGDVVSGDASQIAVNFYRTGNVTIRGLTVHGVGGSGIRFGLSMTDTVGVLVENCEVYDCRQGDAIQGCGRAITIRNNRVGKLGSITANFGDTGIALLYDFNAATNPDGTYSTDWEFSGNTIIGNYNLAGNYVGTGQQIQTGIAVGPFQIGVNVNGRILNNVVFGCYLNCWLIVMDNVTVEGNDFGSHAATATGNTRFDGVTNLKMRGNTITLRLAGTGPDYSGILLIAQRNTFGASVFDADVARCEVTGNTISSIQAGVTGIRVNFGQENASPAYNSKFRASRIENNNLITLGTAVSLAPTSGNTIGVCDDVVIRGNKVDSAASQILMAGGNAGQYTITRLLDNPAPGSVAPYAGTGVGDLAIQHKTMAVVTGATSGSAVTILTIPATGYGRLDVNAYVKPLSGGDATFSATLTATYNNGSARIATKSDGEKLTLTLSGLNIQAAQTTGGANDIRTTGTYS